ncbi:uncharacterized protein B0T23DRAFT_453912 [Neurospora hispaniola]|uniref:Secreted protein n=1 Tax=Neurospora hispaniola TaxID=588809 RepID=A0AAJ0MRY1_9PEZI|nr:hypothetical protein B0T23DRAFT_453912 [Neurospora hispaniola]
MPVVMAAIISASATIVVIATTTASTQVTDRFRRTEVTSVEAAVILIVAGSSSRHCVGWNSPHRCSTRSSTGSPRFHRPPSRDRAVMVPAVTPAPVPAPAPAVAPAASPASAAPAMAPPVSPASQTPSGSGGGNRKFTKAPIHGASFAWCSQCMTMGDHDACVPAEGKSCCIPRARSKNSSTCRRQPSAVWARYS